MAKKSSVYNQSSDNSGSTTMEQLLASLPQRSVSLSRNQQIEGEIVAITDKEIVLDFKSKSEGVLLKKEFNDTQISDLKLGQRIKAFVIEPENEYGQTILSLHPSVMKGSRRRKGDRSYDNFIQAQSQKRELSGYIVEINKGGLIVEVSSTMGFLPNSQVGFDLLTKFSKDSSNLIGQQLKLNVIEVDEGNNRLIFSQRTHLADDIRKKLETFKNVEQVKGKIVAILPFGLVVSIKDESTSGEDALGLEGLVFISDAAWEKTEDLKEKFSIGQEIDAKVIGIDLDLGRINLSIKHLTSDPFTKIAQDFTPDDIVKGEIVGVTDAGVNVSLKEGIEGFLPVAKMDQDTKYEIGKSMNFLIDGIDSQRRRINLAPFVISTEGLIYK